MHQQIEQRAMVRAGFNETVQRLVSAGVPIPAVLAGLFDLLTHSLIEANPKHLDACRDWLYRQIRELNQQEDRARY